MKHFIGGYGLGFIFIFVWAMVFGSYERQKMNAGIAMIFASIFAVPFGLAAWGLLP